jgi:hypothetical protein
VPSIHYLPITKDEQLKGYWIEEVNDPTFLPGHAAAIKLNLGGKNYTIGVFETQDAIDVSYTISPYSCWSFRQCVRNTHHFTKDTC